MKADFRGSKTDHTHTEYFSYLLAIYHIPPEFLAIENNLINGRMSFNCSLDPNEPNCSNNATMSHLTFEMGKTHLLRLINAGGAGNQRCREPEVFERRTRLGGYRKRLRPGAALYYKGRDTGRRSEVRYTC